VSTGGGHAGPSDGTGRAGWAGSAAGRRRWLGGVGAGLAAAALSPHVASASSSYRVGVGRSTDAYTATRRAVAASNEWPAEQIAGRTVLIKPNLVAARSAESGTTTDPHVVRALVDLSLAAGATRVLVAEAGTPITDFNACGYDFLRTYDPAGRVSLVDLNAEPVVLASVPRGAVYRRMYVPSLVLDPGIVFVTVAKLKCHSHTTATLATKNLYGIPSQRYYTARDPSVPWTRVAMHQRDANQTVADFHLVRPCDFAVVDGIWGMEGAGPASGTPVRADTVIAGRNPVAVDRVCLHAMGLGQNRVQHLTYAAMHGLGPSGPGAITVAGDALAPLTFQLPALPPTVWAPVADPVSFSPASGQTALSYRLDADPQAHVETLVEIVRTSDEIALTQRVRLLQPWQARTPGTHGLAWNGVDDAGLPAAPGTYRIRVQGRSQQSSVVANAMGWVVVRA
jgi:uncharacterized protein (DUF362 family)